MTSISLRQGTNLFPEDLEMSQPLATKIGRAVSNQNESTSEHLQSTGKATRGVEPLQPKQPGPTVAPTSQ